MFSLISRLAGNQARSHGGARGGAQPHLEKFEPPPRLPVPFAVIIGVEVYPPPPGILSAPLLTIPAATALLGTLLYLMPL